MQSLKTAVDKDTPKVFNQIKGPTDSLVKRKDGFMRTVKHPEERKNDILNAAEKLFQPKAISKPQLLTSSKPLALQRHILLLLYFQRRSDGCNH